MEATSYPLLKVFTPYSTLSFYKGYFVGACPLCNGMPAKMVVRPDQGNWHCYSCGAGGDPVDFLQSVEELSRDQAYLLYRLLIRDDSAPTPPQPAAANIPEIVATPAAPIVEESAVPAVPPAIPPELPRAEPAKAIVAEQGTLAELRERLGAVDGFRGVAYFGNNGRALMVDGLKAEELAPINAYFDGAFKGTQTLLGQQPDQTIEGVLQDEVTKFIRLDAPIAGSRCRIFLALNAGASEARFRMVIRSFLGSVKAPPG